MRFRLSVHRPDRLVSFCFFSGFMLLAAGCQSGDGAGALGSAATGAKSAGEKVEDEGDGGSKIAAYLVSQKLV